MKINKNNVLLIALLTLTNTIFSSDLNNTQIDKINKQEEVQSNNKEEVKPNDKEVIVKEEESSLPKSFLNIYKSLEDNIGENAAKTVTYSTAAILVVATAALIYKGYEYFNEPVEEDNFDEEDDQDKTQN